MTKRDFREGFTLIELSLSIVFVSILALMIVLIISNTVEAYQKGMTLNNINTVGMDLVDDMRFAVQNSSMKSVKRSCEIYTNVDSAIKQQCESDGAYSFASVTRTAKINLNNQDKNIPVYGAFCTGTYSYIWNSGYFFDNKISGVQMATFKYKMNNATTEKKDFRLLKVRDESRAVCMSAAGWNETSKTYTKDTSLKDNLSSTFNISGDDYASISEEPVDLLLNNDNKNNDLVIYDLYVAKPAESTSNDNVFYSVSFILGTIKGGIDITANGKKCVAPNESEGEYFNYCAVNKFNFAAQANGE